MKKVSILVIVALLIISPVTSFTKTVVSDNDLSDMTAEAGVSISFGNVTVINANLGTVSEGDSDGFTGNTNPGYGGINGVSIVGNLATFSGSAVIDVGTSGGATYVNIGLPAVTFGSVNADATMRLSGSKDLSTGGQLGSYSLIGFYTSAGGGSVQLFAHSSEGLSFNFNNITVMGAANITTASWGDSNGFTGASLAGYMGMGNVAITGNVATLVGSTTAAIDVGTSGTSTSVQISLPTVTLGTMNVDNTLALGSGKNLSGAPTGNVLGVIAVRGFTTQAGGGIQIFAH